MAPEVSSAASDGAHAPEGALDPDAAAALAALCERPEALCVLTDPTGQVQRVLAWTGPCPPAPGEALPDRVAPGDRPRLRDLLSRGDGHAEVTLGDDRTVAVTCRPSGTGGRVLAGTDVTAQRRAEDQFRQVVVESPQPFLIHQDGRIVFGSQSGVQLMAGDSLEDFLGRSILDFLHPSSVDATLERIARVTSTGAPTEASEALVTRLDGTTIAVESVACPITYRGRPAIQTVLWDVTRRKAIQERLAHQAGHDPLTGLANRTRLGEQFEAARSRLQRARVAAVGVVAVDLDGFKDVNDTWGHGVGDDVLRSVAERLRHAVRPSDTVARLGGDEFAAVCDLDDSTEVHRLAARIAEAVGEPLSMGPDAELSVGASVGVATTADAGCSLAELLEEADRRLYASKRARQGR